MARPTIADIVSESGISRATVDRVLNNRPGVHPRTKEIVQRAIARLSSREEPPSDRPQVDFALRLDVGLMAQIKRFASCLEDRQHVIHDMHQADESGVLAVVRQLCEDLDRPLVVTVMNTPSVVAELARARRRGKVVIAMISDLPSEARDAFVGIDNHAAGETVAYLIGRALGDRPTTVGLVLGSHAYRCHQEREMGFRAALRNHFPRIALMGEAIGRDNAETTRAAVLKLLEEHPGIGALYNVSGGNAGMVQAVAEAGRKNDILTICHEINFVTVPLLREGGLAYLISQDPRDLLRESVRQADTARAERIVAEAFVDFGVYTRFNMPSYGQGVQT